MKRNLIAAILIVFVVVSLGATTFDSPKSEEGFKNLKILPKDITKEKLDSVMAHFSVSLGVKCGFCHAQSPDTVKKHLDFASDSKEEKGTAREMFRMVSYINTNFFNDDHSTQPDTIHAVVCYTCHRGTKAPDSKAFLSLIDSTVQAHRKK